MEESKDPSQNNPPPEEKIPTSSISDTDIIENTEKHNVLTSRPKSAVTLPPPGEEGIPDSRISSRPESSKSKRKSSRPASAKKVHSSRPASAKKVHSSRPTSALSNASSRGEKRVNGDRIKSASSKGESTAGESRKSFEKKSRASSNTSAKGSTKSTKSKKIEAEVLTQRADHMNSHPIAHKVTKLTKDEELLIRSCFGGDIDQIYEQLSKGTNTNCRVPFAGTSPLAIACQKGSRSMASVLIDFGARIKLRDDYKCTPIHWAANNGDTRVLQLLLKKGSLHAHDLQMQDEYGSTPLHFASVKNSGDIVNFLLAHGSNPMITNNDNKKPSDVTTDESIKNKLLMAESKVVEKLAEKVVRTLKASRESLVTKPRVQKFAQKSVLKPSVQKATALPKAFTKNGNKFFTASTAAAR